MGLDAATPHGSSPSPPRVAGYTFGAFTLDLRRQVLLADGVEVKLRPRTFDVLTYLVRHAGAVVPKPVLFSAVWGEVAVTDDALVQCLVEIRRALGDAVAVKTVRGRGYILDADARPIVQGVALAAGEPPRGGEPAARSATGSRRMRVLGALLTLGVVTIVAFGASNAGDDAESTGAALPAPPRPETDNQQAYAEYLAGHQALGRRTRAGLRTAVGHFEKAVDLDPDYALAHAGLARALTLVGVLGAAPPLEIYPRAKEAALRATDLDPTLAQAHVALAHLKTQYDWDWAGAEASYRRALALNPKLGDAHGLLALTLTVHGRWDEAMREIALAQQVDPSVPWHLVEGILRFLARDYSRAAILLEQAAAANPLDTMAHFWLALTHVAMGRPEAALAPALASGAEVGNAPTWVLAWIHTRTGRHDAAREVRDAMEERARSTYVPAVDLALLALAFDDRESALRMLAKGFEERSHWMELLAVHPFFDPLRDDPRFQEILERLHLPSPGV